MCMPRNFGAKLVDGKLENKEVNKKKSVKKTKKRINQSKVEFE